MCHDSNAEVAKDWFMVGGEGFIVGFGIEKDVGEFEIAVDGGCSVVVAGLSSPPVLRTRQSVDEVAEDGQ